MCLLVNWLAGLFVNRLVVNWLIDVLAGWSVGYMVCWLTG